MGDAPAMQFQLMGKISADPRECVLAVEGCVRAICQATEKDPAEGTMMLLVAAVHMADTYAKRHRTIAENSTLMAECLGDAIVAADDFFRLRGVRPAQNDAPPLTCSPPQRQ